MKPTLHIDESINRDVHISIYLSIYLSLFIFVIHRKYREPTKKGLWLFKGRVSKPKPRVPAADLRDGRDQDEEPPEGPPEVEGLVGLGLGVM